MMMPKDFLETERVQELLYMETVSTDFKNILQRDRKPTKLWFSKTTWTHHLQQEFSSMHLMIITKFLRQQTAISLTYEKIKTFLETIRIKHKFIFFFAAVIDCLVIYLQIIALLFNVEYHIIHLVLCVLTTAKTLDLLQETFLVLSFCRLFEF